MRASTREIGWKKERHLLLVYFHLRVKWFYLCTEHEISVSFIWFSKQKVSKLYITTYVVDIHKIICAFSCCCCCLPIHKLHNYIFSSSVNTVFFFRSMTHNRVRTRHHSTQMSFVWKDIWRRINAYNCALYALMNVLICDKASLSRWTMTIWFFHRIDW